MEQWAIVEVFGHEAYAGRVSEVSVAGGTLLQIEVPEDRELQLAAFSTMVGHAAIFRLTPCTEQDARLARRGMRSQPLPRWAAALQPAPERPRLTANDFRYLDPDEDPPEDDDVPF